MSEIKGWVNKYKVQPHAGLVHNGGHEAVHVKEVPEGAIEGVGYKCLNCGHVYMDEENVSECDCTVGRYDFKRVRYLVWEEE